MSKGIELRVLISLIVILCATVLVSKLSIKSIINLLGEAGCRRLNYKNNRVTFAAGIAFIPVLLLMSIICMYLYPGLYITYMSYLLSILAMGFAGAIDDLLGEKNIKGLLKHIKSLLKGHLTTGFLKAFIGGLVSISISINISNSVIDLLLNTFNIALFTNGLNLMDLRPGRCTKVFLIIGAVIMLSNINYISSFLPLVVALTAVSVYLVYDLKELCMLGDTGSNILGITLGYFSSLTSTTLTKVFIFIALLVINIAAERVSITSLISKNKFLNYLDNLGRSS